MLYQTIFKYSVRFFLVSVLEVYCFSSHSFMNMKCIIRPVLSNIIATHEKLDLNESKWKIHVFSSPYVAN